ncbi:MAG: PorV/PorQ family protein [Flavobacteriales bacterium]
MERMKMKRMGQRLVAIAASALMVGPSFAGNPNRAGSAGATQLLVNPWARSSGWSLANTATIAGAEAMYGNVAGLAHLHKTELLFTNTRWLEGTGVKINAVGFGQRLGSGVLGITATTFSFGELPVRTIAQPEGGLGTFSPTQANIGVAYAKEFSNSIYGGVLVRVVSESIANVRTSGFCFDAGIHYVTGPSDNVHFGIALKNVGPAMRFSGDGLSVQGLLGDGSSDQMTLEQRSAQFELPSMMNIGAAYDFNLTELHRITVAGNFTSNSFTRDQFILGAEYAFKKMFHVRGGYLWEKNVTDAAARETAFTGPSGGVSVDFPFGEEKKSKLAIDYGYRATNPFNGVHSIGIRLSL